MSDGGEKTCPLCAEEMDLTDQQLKPCKCGYEICVWCWHHIMDMAEKDETEGRCPACRTPYNKGEIVGMTANCGRLLAEMNTERKLKSQKTKSKTSEGRKHLSSVRVIQRNLVYIVGLPLNLADEDVLQHREYFGQYGKVLKVSISRTAAGAIQHFANSTCSVYITYAKEDEAVRCIRSVHGFILEGRSLRACFGTTKYCHAWLRNMPCSNPDCLYLHEIGSQEDSFTKDEIISAYTRSRVQQITGATHNIQRCSGSVLPPPADEYCDNSSASSGKSIIKTSTNNPASSLRGSPPNSSSGRSTALPAAASWGMRASNKQPQATSLEFPNGSSNEKPDTCSGSVAFSTAVASPAQISILHADVEKKLIPKEESCTTQQKGKLETLESAKLCMATDCRIAVPETPATTGLPATSPKENDSCINISPNTPNSFDLSGWSSGPGAEKDLSVATNGVIQSLCSDMSSMSIDKHQMSQQCYNEQISEPRTLLATGNANASSKDIYVKREKSDLRLDSQSQVAQVAIHEVEKDLLSYDDQRLKDPEFTHRSYLPYSSHSLHLSNHSTGYFPQHNGKSGSLNVNMDPHIIDKKVEKGILPASSIPVISNGYPDDTVCSSAALNCTVEHSYLLPHDGKRKHVGRFGDETANFDYNAVSDMGESSIISNMLSIDFDSWLSNSWKIQNNNESRFSFAREEESINQVSDVEQSLSNFGQALKNGPFSHDSISSSREFYFDKIGNCNGFSSVNTEESDNFVSSHISSNKLSGSRAQASTPPGFSVPSRAPPPGFMSNERMEQAFNPLSGNHSLSASSFRNPYQVQSAENFYSTGDIEFMDPAILAVGNERVRSELNSPRLGMRSNFPPHLITFENEARLQLLMQRSISPHQNQRFSEMGDRISSVSDAHGIPLRITEQTVINNLSPFSQLTLPQSRNTVMSNGHWDGWNDVQSGNDLGIAELLRTEKLGLDKFYTGYEDSKFRMPSSGNLYNRTFGI